MSRHTLLLFFAASLAYPCDKGEERIFHCRTEDKKTFNLEVELCSKKDFLQIRYMEKGAVRFVVPAQGQPSAFAYGEHALPDGGKSYALGVGADQIDATIDAVEEPTDKKEMQKTFEFSWNHYALKQSGSFTCANITVDKVASTSQSVKKIDYFTLLEGLTPKKDDALAETSKDAQWLESCCKKAMQLHPTSTGTALDGSYFGGADKQHAFFTTLEKDFQKNTPSSVAYKALRGNSKGVLALTITDSKKTVVIYGFEDFGIKSFDLDQFDVVKQAKLPKLSACVGDGLAFEDEKDKTHIACFDKNSNIKVLDKSVE